MKFLQKLTLFFSLLFCLCHQTNMAQELEEKQMTVQELAEKLEENNIHLKLANAQVEVANARIGEVKTNRLPDIGVDMSGMYLSDVNIYDKHWSKVQKVDIPNFGHQMNISANQLIFTGGRVNKAVKLAELNKNLSQNQLEDTEQSLKLNAAELYLSLYNLQNQKKILQSNILLAEERTKNARHYFEQDMITKNEVLRAEVLERQLKQSILEIQNAILITNKNLILFAGLDDNILIIPDVSNLDHMIRQQDELFFRQLAYQNNPQLDASEVQIAIAKKNLELTKTDKMPTLAAFAGYNATRPMTTTTPALDYYSNTYQVGLNLSYNIESLFKNRKKAAVDKALIDQAELAKEAVRQQIDAQVNQAYKNYRQAVAQKAVSLVNEAAANENYRITELKYKNQLVTLIEIIDASNTKLQAELQTLDDQTNIILNYVKLLRACGQL